MSVTIHSHSFAFIPKSLNIKHLIKQHLIVEANDPDSNDQFFYEETDDYWVVPRFFPEWLKKHYNLDLQIEYGHVDPVEIDFECSIQPRDKLQEKAIAYLSKPMKRFGILRAKPGFGKTIVTIKAIHNLKQKSLVVVPKIDLATQWKDRILEFTNIPEDKIPIFAGKLDKDSLDSMYIGIAIVNTLANRYLKRDLEIHKIMYEAGIGAIFFDECHTIIPTHYFHKAQGILYANRYIGLSATPFRDNDKLTRIIYYNLGDDIYDIADYDIKAKCFEVYFDSQIPQKTKTWICWGNRFSVQRYLKKVVECKPFVEIVMNLIKQAYNAGRRVLVLAPRKDVLHLLGELAQNQLGIDDIGYFYSGQPKEELKHQLVFATSQIFKEGIDVPELDTLIVLDQIGNRTVLEQQIGRILRKSSNKKDPKVVFLIDKNFELQHYLSLKRRKIYKQIGFKFEVIDLTNQGVS